MTLDFLQIFMAFSAVGGVAVLFSGRLEKQLLKLTVDRKKR